jgi:hypothetical protein
MSNTHTQKMAGGMAQNMSVWNLLLGLVPFTLTTYKYNFLE